MGSEDQTKGIPFGSCWLALWTAEASNKLAMWDGTICFLLVYSGIGYLRFSRLFSSIFPWLYMFLFGLHTYIYHLPLVLAALKSDILNPFQSQYTFFAYYYTIHE